MRNLLRRVHHGETTAVAVCVSVEDTAHHVDVIIADQYRMYTGGRFVVTEEEEGDEQHAQ